MDLVAVGVVGVPVAVFVAVYAVAELFEEVVAPAERAQLSGVRTFGIAAGETATYNLVCDHFGAGSSNLESTVLSAIFIPAAPL